MRTRQVRVLQSALLVISISSVHETVYPHLAQCELDTSRDPKMCSPLSSYYNPTVQSALHAVLVSLCVVVTQTQCVPTPDNPTSARH
ncbi:hypothetical protein PF005_g7096 [Phytophthora fragariae]|uniref:FZ domain-containing protein n=1 Tax=Phytophthora fragariae TaxID=53985 RepID=A0A6A4E4W2_9STRA|nr:hypothetical protein PF003_g29993 [Phytophthora fragariae]KAE8941412.1 hypothetical protein PF009_g8804 [Phytophthora fragariae]KAE9017363.1 hypothetical protein PF011_g6731 [Phytophthora fragariae]KAE9122187.1 hypothetical protein PF007_g7543 [Phytophthora fragariae]KAE9123104.1 hypothetical protein PF010_g6524 [Phytophthora fragariae]